MALQITDIQTQKKREGYYSIFINEEYSFSLSELDLSAANLHIGQTVSEEAFEELKKRSLVSKTYNRALYYLRYGPRTTAQMQQYLARKAGFAEEEITLAITRLVDEGYLDDTAYVESFLEARQISRPRSKRQLAAELQKKGVPRALVDEKLSEIGEDSQIQAVLQIAQKKMLLPRFQDKQKLIEYLMRQGFSYSVIKQALAELG